MKKPEIEDEDIPEFRLEDLGRAERGKHHADYQKGTNLVLLRPEVAAAFPTAEAVNQALLGLMTLATNIAVSKESRSAQVRRRG